MSTPRKWSGCAETEVIKEDLIKCVIVILAGVDQYVVDASSIKPLMTHASRMISGRVPTIVITFTRRLHRGLDSQRVLIGVVGVEQLVGPEHGHDVVLARRCECCAPTSWACRRIRARYR